MELNERLATIERDIVVIREAVTTIAQAVSTLTEAIHSLPKYITTRSLGILSADGSRIVATLRDAGDGTGELQLFDHVAGTSKRLTG